jgi:hypothetical protein
MALPSPRSMLSPVAPLSARPPAQRAIAVAISSIDPLPDSRFVDKCQCPAKVKEPAPTRATERLPEPCRARTRPNGTLAEPYELSKWLAPRDGVICPGAGRGNNKELGKRRRPRLRTGTDMGHSAIDRRLDEVKEVLQRFQHFEQASVGPAPASKDATHPSRARAAIAPIFAAAAVMLTVLGTYTFFSCKQCPDSSARLSANRPLQGTASPDETVPSRSKATVPPAPPAARAVVQSALQQMASGRVQAARTELVRTEASADVAWALARSYDPNFLSTIQTADAAPNVVQATRWYLTWHTLAVKEGLVADSVSVERIIRSIQKPP